jgi:hypothetical protein
MEDMTWQEIEELFKDSEVEIDMSEDSEDLL